MVETVAILSLAAIWILSAAGLDNALQSRIKTVNGLRVGLSFLATGILIFVFSVAIQQ